MEDRSAVKVQNCQKCIIQCIYESWKELGPVTWMTVHHTTCCLSHVFIGRMINPICMVLAFGTTTTVVTQHCDVQLHPSPGFTSSFPGAELRRRSGRPSMDQASEMKV